MPEEKKSVVPRLRFPEFRDARVWEVRTIEELATKIALGGTPKTSVPEYWNGEVLWITPAEMGDDASHHYTETTHRAISSEGLQASSAELLPVNSVIISSRAPIGYVTINKVEMATNQGCKGIVPKERTYHEFLYFSLLVANQRLNDLGAGAGFKEISTSALKAFQIPVPEPPEQQKIADCLASLDEVINLQTQKLDTLKTHKEGLMQHLFPREGETTPRLRFPEFRDAGEWEVKQLGDICQMTAGEFVAASKIKEATADNLYPCYGGNGLRGFTKTFTHEGIYPLIGRQGALCGNITLATGKFHATEHAVVVTPRKNTLTNWLYYQLVRLNLNQFATGQAQPGLSIANLNGVPVAIPQGEDEQQKEEEQQKIADCLSSLDEVINLETQKLDAIKAHKKGLMQQLFTQEVD